MPNSAADFRREYRQRLPWPLAELYSRAFNRPAARSRHDNAFYLCEALVKLAASPAVACYLRELDRGGPRVEKLDRLLAQLARPSLGQWLAILRELARHFGQRVDAGAHPLGHLWSQLNAPRADLPHALALYRRIKNGADGESAADTACSLLDLFNALVQYRNGVFGHGGPRFEAFFADEMGPLLLPALNDLLAEGILDALGPPGTRLVYLAEQRTLDDGRVQIALRELVGADSERLAPLELDAAQAAELLPGRVAVLWPGHTLPLRLDPLLRFRESELAEEVLLLNSDLNGREAQYLSYTTGRTERDKTMAAALAALLSRLANRPVDEAELERLGQQSTAERMSVEPLFAAATPTGQMVGDYQLLAELGRGGMGVVYLARQQSLGRLVALKMLPADLAESEVSLARFKREMRHLARTNHPHIVKVLDSGTLPDGRMYYTMEYIPGSDLEQVWRELSDGRPPASASSLGNSTWCRAVLGASRKQRARAEGSHAGHPPPQGAEPSTQPAVAPLPLPPLPLPLPPLPELPDAVDDPGGYVRRVVMLVRDAALALQSIHDQGIVHRDVSPANLMLTPDGSRIVLMDFGLAKGQTASSLSQQGGFLGKLRYAAPEQLAAAMIKVGPAADIRGLGVTLWELLTRRRLFGDADERQLPELVQQHDVPALRSIDSSFDRDLEAIVARATERRTSSRIQSAGKLADYLQLYLDGQPLPIRPPGIGELLARWVREHRPLVASAATAAAAIVLVTALAFALVNRARDEAIAARNELAIERNAAVDARDQARQARDSAELSWRRAVASEADALESARRAKALNHFLIDDVLAAASPERARGTKLSIEDVVKSAGQHVDKTLGGQPDAQAAVHNVIGITLLRMGLYADAEEHLRQALALFRQSLGAETPEAIEVMNNLAALLKDRGKLAEAEPLVRQTLEARRRHQGPDSPDVLGTESNLALLLQAQGKLSEAGKLAEQNLEHYRKVLGASDPDTLLSQQNLAMIWAQQGRLSEAEPLLRETLTALIQNKKIGRQHPYTLSTQHNLARLLQTKGELEEAEKLNREVVAIRTRMSGPEHPEALIATNQLATLLLDRGKLDEAEPLVQQLLASAVNVLGDDHPQSIAARQNMARLLEIEGRPQEAEPLLRKNLEACIKVYGLDYPDTLMAMGNLAVGLQAEGKLSEAEPLVREVVKSQTALLGPDHPHTLVSINNLVILLGAQGKLDEAEPLARKNLVTCRRVLGPNHPDTLLAMSNIAQLMEARGHWSEAEPLLRESLEIRRRELGDSHPDTLNAMDDLVTVLSAESMLPEAEQLLEKTIDIRRRVLGPKHTDTRKSIRTLAMVMDARGEFREAEPLLRELIQHDSRKPGLNATEALADATTLALNLEHQKQPAEAETLLRDVVARLRKQTPPAGALLAEALTVLADFLLRQNRPADAEPFAREAVELGRKQFGDGHWQTAFAENVLGTSLLDLGRYSEAEPPLVSSLGILQSHTTARSGLGRQALERVVRLYQAWGKPQQAAEWKQRLAETEKPSDEAADQSKPAKPPAPNQPME